MYSLKLNRLVHSRWCCDRYVRISLPHTIYRVRSLIGARRSDSWIPWAVSQCRWNVLPQAPPTFSRSPVDLAHSAWKGFEKVSFSFVHIGFFSKIRLVSPQASARTSLPKALRTSNSVQPPSWSTSSANQSNCIFRYLLDKLQQVIRTLTWYKVLEAAHLVYIAISKAIASTHRSWVHPITLQFFIARA